MATVQPATTVFTQENTIFKLTSIPGELNAYDDPKFEFSEYFTIVVKSDLFAFRSAKNYSKWRVKEMRVMQFENACTPEDGF